MSASRVQPGGESYKQLTLLKQKVKRGQSASDANNLDNLREESADQLHPYKIITPQPPTYSKAEDGRFPARSSESTTGNNSSHFRTDTTALNSHEGCSPAHSKNSNVAVHHQETAIDMWQYEVGLDNLGNTCFMNSILQCLLHVEPLVRFFMRSNVEAHLNLASPKKGALASAFCHLVRDIYKKRSGSSVSPINIQKAVCTHAPYLMDFQQQDSQEFLRFLLDGMSEDLCRKHSEQEPDPPPSLARSASKSSSSILPALPAGSFNSPNSVTGNVQDFLRTAPPGAFGAHPSSEQRQNGIFSSSARNSPIPSAGGVGRAASTAQRLRDETKAMRIDNAEGGIPTHVKSKSNNQGEEEDNSHSFSNHSNDYSDCSGSNYTNNIDNNSNNNNRISVFSPNKSGVSGSSSSYVNRMRRRSAEHSQAASIEAGANIAETETETGEDTVLPFSPVGPPSTEKGARSSALLHSADVCEDFSADDEDSSPAVSPSKSNSYDQQQQLHQEEDGPMRRMRKTPTRPTGHIPNNIHQRQQQQHHQQQQQQQQQQQDDCVLTEVDSLPLLSPMMISTSTATPGGNVKSPDGVAGNQRAAEKEASMAWMKYLKLNDSVVTDIFAGQLQSTIECLTCRHRSSTYDPFLDLSVPIPRDSDTPAPARHSILGSLRNSVGVGSAADCNNKSTLEKCLEKFTAEELLEGENMYTCEKCKTKRKSAKKLSIYKYPQVLVIHIKRFKYSSTRREKLSTDVRFPVLGLDLSPYVSADLPTVEPAAQGAVRANNNNDALTGTRSGAAGAAGAGGTGSPAPLYDLIGVSNHHGSLHSGHYIAHVDTTGGRRDKAKRWMCFNDSKVSTANVSSIAGPTAYVLFYKLQNST